MILLNFCKNVLQFYRFFFFFIVTIIVYLQIWNLFVLEMYGTIRTHTHTHTQLIRFILKCISLLIFNTCCISNIMLFIKHPNMSKKLFRRFCFCFYCIFSFRSVFDHFKVIFSCFLINKILAQLLNFDSSVNTK